MKNQPIACELHDYIEIACMYGYRVKLMLTEHRIVEGKATDVLIEQDKREFLVIDDGERQKVELSEIVEMETRTPGAKFQSIRFK